jgi:hypothetical protein
VSLVGGLSSPIRGSYKEPLQIDDSPGQSSQPWPPFSRDACSEENHKLLLESMNPGSRELNNDEEEGSEADTEETTSPPDSPRSLLTQLHEWQNPKMADVTSNVSELELRKLERGKDCCNILHVCCLSVCVSQFILLDVYPCVSISTQVNSSVLYRSSSVRLQSST